MTQANRVLRELERGRKLTSAKAFTELGIMDLPKRISELKEQGHAVMSRTVKDTNRYGEPVHYKEYWLASDDWFQRRNTTLNYM